MRSIADLQQHITHEIANIKIPDHPQNLYDPVRYILQIGGKHIRPLLTLLATDLFAESQLEKAVPAALAVELFHNFTLMHDDIMDNAPLRRGQQTVHEKWDANTAILSGDNMLVMAYQYLAKCDGDKLPLLLDTFNRTASEVCKGQQLDMDFEQQTRVEIAEYINMIRLKTSVLLGGALKLGAIIGDATAHDADALYRFGVNVGIAFQLQDDMLDVFGDPKAFGKQVGGDILANKKTYMFIRAFELADHETKEALTHWFSSHLHNPARKIAAVKAIYTDLHIQEEAQHLMNAYSHKAYDALAEVDVQDEKKQELYALARKLLVREN